MSDFFIKQVGVFFAPDKVRLIYENSLRYYKAAQPLDGLSVPKPLSHTNTEIVFEKLSGMKKTLAHEWFHDNRWDAPLCRKIGCFLGKLHKAQGNLSEKIYIHGDFVPHNIAIRDKDMVFFDYEPPGRHADFMHFYHNYNYIDLASFIFFIFISHSFKRPWRFFRNKQSFVASFLSGYETGASFVCDRNILLRHIEQECRKWYADYQFHVVRKLIEYGIIRNTLFVQLSLYHVLR